MAVTPEFLNEVKLYAKIDFDFEDSIIKTMIESAQEQICFAKTVLSQKILRLIPNLS